MEYTARLKTIISYAGQETVRLGNSHVSPEHLMLGILRMAEGTAYDILNKTKVNFSELKHVIDDHVRQEPPEQIENNTIHLSPAGERIIRLVGIERDAYGAEVAGSIHLLLAILRERINFVARTMESVYGITYEVIEELYPKPERVMADGTDDSKVESEEQIRHTGTGCLRKRLDTYGY